MQPRTPKLLEDICDAAAFIVDAARGKSLDDYRRDRLLRNAVERNFEVVGEAIRRREAFQLLRHRRADRHLLTGYIPDIDGVPFLA